MSEGTAGTPVTPVGPIGLDGLSVRCKRGYSLNKLYSDYHGPCMRVKVGIGTTPEFDIGFVDNKVDVDALMALSGVDENLILVTRWYDQSGNGKDAIATAFVTGFPVMVGSGVIEHVNGWPQVHINRSSLVFDNSDAAQTNFTLVCVFSITESGDGPRWFQMAGLLYADVGGAVNDFGFGVFNEELTLGLGPADSGPFSQSPVGVIDGLLHAGWATRDQTTTLGKIYVDSTTATGSQALSGGARTDSATCAIGSYNGTFIADFLTCEALVFATVLDEADMILLRAWQAQYTDGQPTDQSDLLLHFDVTPLVDSGKNHLTPSIDGLLLSTSQFKFGPGSNNNGLGGGHCLFVSSTLILGGQDFTIDAWVRINGLDVFEQYVFDSRLDGTDSSGTLLIVTSDGHVATSFGIGLLQSLAPISLNVWTHLEIGRSGNLLYLFVNGVLQGTMAVTTSLSSDHFCVASGQYFPIGIRALNGYLDEFHVKIGQCLHTANFTPRTTPYNS